MAKIIAVLRDRQNGDPVAGEDVNFRTPADVILDTEVTSADGSATYVANGNPAGLLKWDATVSGEEREASARAMRQIGALFEAEIAKSFLGIVSNGVSPGDGDECAVVPGSGRQVTVGTGCIWVQGIPFHFYTDTNLSTTANASLATRLDYVVLRVELDDSATDYGMGTLVVIEGTVSGVAPTLSQDTGGTYEYPLALVTSAMGFSSYTSGNISDQREGVAPASHVHVMADVTDLAAALALKANLASPTFTGTISAQAISAAAIAATSLSTAGAVTAGNGLTVTTGTVNFPAGAIDAADIGGGNVSDAEFDTLNGINTGSTIAAQLDAKAPTTSPTFTGNVKITQDNQEAFVVEDGDGTDRFRVDNQFNEVGAPNGGVLTVWSDAYLTKTWTVDGSTGNVTTGGATITPAEFATLDGIGSTAIATQLAAKASLSGATFTGSITTNGSIEIDGALNHDGSTVGFYGATPVAKQADPGDIGTGTIDATWGSTEASIMEQMRTNINDIKEILRNLGLITA
jgi:hypothetical protein